MTKNIADHLQPLNDKKSEKKLAYHEQPWWQGRTHVLDLDTPVPINIENVTQIKSTFEELEKGTQGVSTGINKNGVEIKIDPVFWSNSSLIKKWYLIYHELGHDVLNFKHGEGGKMMFNYTFKDYSWYDFEEDRQYMFESYIDKLNQQKSRLN